MRPRSPLTEVQVVLLGPPLIGMAQDPNLRFVDLSKTARQTVQTFPGFVSQRITVEFKVDSCPQVARFVRTGSLTWLF